MNWQWIWTWIWIWIDGSVVIEENHTFALLHLEWPGPTGKNSCQQHGNGRIHLFQKKIKYKLIWVAVHTYT